MRPGISRCIVLTLAVAWEAAAHAAEPTHCGPSEEVIYACTIRSSAKIVSLCASKQLEERTGYLQYRYGRPGKIELEFPAERDGSLKRFQYANYFRYQYDLTELRFSNGGVDYVVYSYYSGEEKPAVSRTGVRVNETSLPCGRRVTNRLSALEKVVPRGPI